MSAPHPLPAAAALALALALALAGASPAQAQEGPDAPLEALLARFHPGQDVATLRALTPEPEAALGRLLARPDLGRAAKVRALALLGELNSDAAATQLERALADPQLAARLQMAALLALARGYPSRATTLTRLQTGLRSADPGVRKAAVTGLAQLPGGAPRALLRAQLKDEPAAGPRAALNRALGGPR